MNLFEHVQRTTGLQLLPLLEISCDLFTETLRLAAVDLPDPVVSNGISYTCIAFDFKLPQDGDSVSSQMTLMISHGGSDITNDLEAWQPGHPLKAKLLLADPSNPDTIFKTFFIPISDVSVDASQATATCGNNRFMEQKAVKLRYDQYFAPGLF